MLFRKFVLFFSAAVLSLLAGCTTRYEDMLRERDQRIRELVDDNAQLRSTYDDLQRRQQARPEEATAAPRREEGSGELKNLQNEFGDNATISYRRGRISIGVNDSVSFDSGSVALKDSAHRVLQNVANVLKNRYSGRRYYIEGHTDNDPISKTKDKFRSNRHLSMERADAVARYLIAQGVPESSIVVVGYGQFDPVQSAKNKGQNRRVEIVIGDPVQ
jgi:chemotaxis protein MotB